MQTQITFFINMNNYCGGHNDSKKLYQQKESLRVNGLTYYIYLVVFRHRRQVAKNGQATLYPRRFGVLDLLDMLLCRLVLGDIALTTMCNAEIGIAVLASSTALKASGDPGKFCDIFVAKLGTVLLFLCWCIASVFCFSFHHLTDLLRVQINNGTETTNN